MSEPLSRHEREILETLNVRGGFTTRHVAKHVTAFGSNAHQHSGAVRTWLLGLKKRGLVDYLYDQKPVCWMLTEAGARALKEAERRDTEWQATHGTVPPPTR